MEHKTIAIEKVRKKDGDTDLVEYEEFVFDIWPGHGRKDLLSKVEGVSSLYEIFNGKCKVYIDHRYNPADVLTAIEQVVKEAEEREKSGKFVVTVETRLDPATVKAAIQAMLEKLEAGEYGK